MQDISVIRSLRTEIQRLGAAREAALSKELHGQAEEHMSKINLLKKQLEQQERQVGL